MLKAKDKDLGVNAYYNHHEASKARRSQVAYFITNMLNHGSECLDNCDASARVQYNAQTIEHRFDNHALSFLEVTGSNIAKNLPFYTVLYE
mmetsp:Transcript_11364/g.12880  ORF Transcript_11364/g.12880 Transcript_11364/m.12880 type:complete len:91 (-) Transcript_11364:24-296(-)